MPAAPVRIRIKSIALPTEHGGWGFLFEPLVLGLFVSPTPSGFCYALAAVAAFLARHPLKLAYRHVGEVTRSPRYRIAAQFAAAYVIVAAAAFIGAVLMAGWRPVVPIIVLSPLILVFLLFDTQNRGRSLLPELAGPLGLAASAPAIALAAGWSWTGASALWVVLMARTLPSIFYVRARLRLERGKSFDAGSVVIYHVAFAVVVGALAWRGLTTWATVLAFAILVLRAIIGLSRYRRLRRAQQVGISEIAYGLIYVLIVAIGYLASGGAATR